MADYKTPGVYVEEISLLPPSVAQVETAIPAFIGYTENHPSTEPKRITSMVDYIKEFGGPAKTLPKFSAIRTARTVTVSAAVIKPTPDYRMFYALQFYFGNGGGPCYVASAGKYAATPAADFPKLNDALDEVKKVDEPTLLVFPDASMLSDVDQYHALYDNALQQCGDLQDRFTICDVLPDTTDATTIGTAPSVFRNKLGTSNLKYGAAYFPYLQTILQYHYQQSEMIVNYKKDSDPAVDLKLRYLESELKAKAEEMKADDKTDAEIATEMTNMKNASLFHVDNEAYQLVKGKIDGVNLVLPPSSAVAGIYAAVDSTRGVWKAPANVSVRMLKKPTVIISSEDQENLNIDVTAGKSINAIRTFVGRGHLIWGARTLAGNDNEWRYISVRRFYNMVEESVKKATEAFVFEPNDANTWVKVRAMIENFLILQWRAGALMGAAPEQAFFVKVGLGETMTGIDVLEGRMIVEIGMAVVRPAEFIILRFSHFMQEA